MQALAHNKQANWIWPTQRDRHFVCFFFFFFLFFSASSILWKTFRFAQIIIIIWLFHLHMHILCKKKKPPCWPDRTQRRRRRWRRQWRRPILSVYLLVKHCVFSGTIDLFSGCYSVICFRFVCSFVLSFSLSLSLFCCTLTRDGGVEIELDWNKMRERRSCYAISLVSPRLMIVHPFCLVSLYVGYRHLMTLMGFD